MTKRIPTLESYICEWKVIGNNQAFVYENVTRAILELVTAASTITDADYFSGQESNMFHMKPEFVTESVEDTIEEIIGNYADGIFAANVDDNGRLCLYGIGGWGIGSMPKAKSIEELFSKNPYGIDDKDIAKAESQKEQYKLTEILRHFAVVKISFPIKLGDSVKKMSNLVELEDKDIQKAIRKYKIQNWSQKEVIKDIHKQLKEMTFEKALSLLKL